jgi:hypothetical protein
MAEGTLPELVALEDLDFEEEDEIPALTDPVADTLSLKDQNLDNLEQHLDWLFAEDSPPPAPETPTVKTSKPDEVIEIIDFEEQFLDAEEIPEEIPAEMYEHGPEEEETPEFLDIEEAEPDNELVWFDTLEPPDETPKDLAPHPPLMENLTAASLGRAAEPVPPTAMSPPEDIAAAVSAAAAAVSPAPASAASAAPPADGPSPAVDIDSIPMDRLEAAVANVIARSYSGRIEAIILQAIEKAVARDIERLRNELLDRDPEGKPV